jgi:hypothetical protein
MLTEAFQQAKDYVTSKPKLILKGGEYHIFTYIHGCE